MRLITKDQANLFLEMAREVEKEKALWRFIYLKTTRSAKNLTSLIKLSLSKTRVNMDYVNITIFDDCDVFVLVKGDTYDLTKMIQNLYANLQEVEPLSDDILDLSVHWDEFVHIVKEKVTPLIKKEAIEKDASTKEHKSFDYKASAEAISHVQRLKAKRSQTSAIILLVDDEPMTLQVIEKVLNDYKTVQAQNAFQAMEQYEKYAPDIVFLDINLPDASGHKVLEAIKALDPSCYVVMLSGNSFPEEITFSMKSGAAGFVAKPFSRSKLVYYIQGRNKNGA